MIRPVPELLKLAPTQVGYRVTAAVNGPAPPALRPAIREEIRLLLTDLVTPDGLTGRDLARGLLADRADLPVLFYQRLQRGSGRDGVRRGLGDQFPAETLHHLETAGGDPPRPRHAAPPGRSATGGGINTHVSDDDCAPEAKP